MTGRGVRYELDPSQCEYSALASILLCGAARSCLLDNATLRHTMSTFFQRAPLSVMLSICLIAGLAGCGRPEPPATVTQSEAHEGQPDADQGPLGQVTEFDGFTLRANVIRSEFLPDAMVRKYGIEAAPDLTLLNLVILENRADGASVPISAKLSARYESLVGHVEAIEMREVEVDGQVSYIGSVDASTQRVFRFVIEAQPEGTDSPLRMDFEVQLYTFDSD